MVTSMGDTSSANRFAYGIGLVDRVAFGKLLHSISSEFFYVSHWVLV